MTFSDAFFFLGTLRVKLNLFLQVSNADNYCNHYECEGRIEKKCFEAQCLASRGLPSDEKWSSPRDIFFYLTLTQVMDFFFLLTKDCLF